MALGSGPVPPKTPVRPGLIRAGYAAWALVGILVLAVFAVWILYQIRAVFPPLVLALAIIFLLNPLVSRLQRIGVGRAISTIGIYLIALTAFAILIAVLTPVLRAQFQDLVAQLPELQRNATRLGDRIARLFGVSLEESLSTTLERLREQLLSGVGQITRLAEGAAHLAIVLVLAPFIALYILIDLPRLQKSFVAHLPPHYRDEWLVLLERCGQAVGGFFRGQLLVAFIVATLSAVALVIIGVPFWLPLGLLVGFFNLIPLIGPLVGGGVAVVVAGIDNGLGSAVVTGLAMVAVQQLDNHLISPNVMGRTLRLHPVTIILALLAGGTIAGLFGMLLAVPGVAVAKILLMHYYATHVLGRPPEMEQESDIVEDTDEAQTRASVERELLPEETTELAPAADGSRGVGAPPRSNGWGPAAGRIYQRASQWLQSRMRGSRAR
jgi:predicted PurR-regulated permease PerM